MTAPSTDPMRFNAIPPMSAILRELCRILAPALRGRVIACVPLLLACSVTLAQSPPAKPPASKASAAKPAASSPPNQAGVITLVEGEARIAPGGTDPRPVKVGDVVNEGDLIVTSKDGEVHMTMQDTGFMVLRPNTRLRVVNYKADGGDDDTGVFRLLSGGLRSITGWIGRFNTRGYQVRTPSSTIGIRGTDHETRYIPEGSAEGEPGTYDRVYAGQTYIETPAGQAAISPNQAGFVSVRPRDKPRLLAAIPRFFKPGPHEAEIEKKHAEIQQLIEQRREERRKVIAEKRAALAASRAKTKDMLEQNKAEASQARQSLQEMKLEAKAKREALQRDMAAAQAMREDVQKTRAALEEDVKAGTITVPDMRKRRKALLEKERALAKAQESIEQRRKALAEETDARIEERFRAAEERRKATHEQVLDARGKRKSLEEEKASASDEMKALRKEEGKRYWQELKEDRSGAKPPDAPAKQ
jgi:hypothetical protein